MIRLAWVSLNVILATGSIGILVLLAAALRAPGSVHQWFTRTWARWILLANGTRVQVEGMEHVAPDRPQVIAANHVSWFDVLAIAAALPKRIRFIAKKELAAIPLFGPAWKAAGHIAIDRSNLPVAVAALEHAGRLMRADRSAVVIFPEGTRAPSYQLLPFKKGAFMLALVTGVEIVPAAVVGSRAIMPRDSWRLRGGRITLRFAPPVDTTAYGDSNRDELIARVRGTIEQLLAEPLPRAGLDERESR